MGNCTDNKEKAVGTKSWFFTTMNAHFGGILWSDIWGSLNPIVFGIIGSIWGDFKITSPSSGRP